MTTDAFEDPAAFTRDLPLVPPFFAHRVAVIVDAYGEAVARLMTKLPAGTIVFGAYVERATMGHGDQLDLHVCLVHPALPVVPEMVSAPRVSLSQFVEAVTGPHVVDGPVDNGTGAGT